MGVRRPRGYGRRGLLGVALALGSVVPAAAISGCGASSSGSAGSSSPGTVTSSATPGSLTFSPSRPTTASEIAFGFTAPQATGIHGKSDYSYSLSVTGPAGGGCVSAHEAAGPPATQHQTVSITVGPTQLGKPWCAGSYTARVFELARAACAAGVPCPQYVRVVGTVAQGAFTITTG